MATVPEGGGSPGTPWFGYPISQGFKWTPSNTHAHSGIDIRDPQGTAITAPQSGTIISQGMEPWGGQVNELVQTPQGPEVISFLHLSQLSPSGLGHVNAGARIGSSGTPPPGYGNGPHLHFEMSSGSQPPYMSSYNPWFPTGTSHPINPSAYIAGLNIAGIGSSGGASVGTPDQVANHQIINYPGGSFDVTEAIDNALAPMADALKRGAVFVMAGMLTIAGLYLMLKPQIDGAVHDAIRGAEGAAL